MRQDLPWKVPLGGASRLQLAQLLVGAWETPVESGDLPWPPPRAGPCT